MGRYCSYQLPQETRPGGPGELLKLLSSKPCEREESFFHDKESIKSIHNCFNVFQYSFNDRIDRSKYQSEVTVIGGAKEQKFFSSGGETFIWQVSGESVVTVNGDSSETLMRADETLLVPAGAEYGVRPADASFRALTCKMDPDAKKRMKF